MNAAGYKLIHAKRTLMILNGSTRDSFQKLKGRQMLIRSVLHGVLVTGLLGCVRGEGASSQMDIAREALELQSCNPGLPSPSLGRASRVLNRKVLGWLPVSTVTPNPAPNYD